MYINWSVFKSSYCEEKQCVGHADIEGDIPPSLTPTDLSTIYNTFEI